MYLTWIAEGGSTMYGFHTPPPGATPQGLAGPSSSVVGCKSVLVRQPAPWETAANIPPGSPLSEKDQVYTRIHAGSRRATDL